MKRGQRKLYELCGSPDPIGYLWEQVSVGDAGVDTLEVWFGAAYYKSNPECYSFLHRVHKEANARGHRAFFVKDALRITY